MYFSSNVFENNSMMDKNTEQMLGYQNDSSKINPLNEINQNTYQSKSDTKIRKKITFNKMKNSINAVCKEYNEKKSIINNSNKNNASNQSNNNFITSKEDSFKDNSELLNIDTNKVLENKILSRSNNVYITNDNTEEMLWPNKKLNNNNCNNHDYIQGNSKEVNNEEFKKSKSVNINDNNTLDGETKNIIEWMKRNRDNNINQNILSNNLYVYNNNTGNNETQMMLDRNKMINQSINNMNNMNSLNGQNSLFNNNNFNNGMFGNFKVYSYNS